MSQIKHRVYTGRRAILRRRALAFRKEYSMQWTRRETNKFINRLLHITETGGVDDIDLRHMVRMYNREVIGCTTSTLR